MVFTHTTYEVMDALRVSRTTLNRLRAEDILRPGCHFTAVGPGLKKPALRWDMNQVEATLARRGKQGLRAPSTH